MAIHFLYAGQSDRSGSETNPPGFSGESKSGKGQKPAPEEANKNKDLPARQSGGKKRPLQSPPERPAPKRSFNFSDVVKLDLTVIIKRKWQTIDGPNYHKLRALLVDLVEGAELDWVPRFDGVYHKEGACFLSCADARSRDWVHSQAVTLRESMPELNLWFTSLADDRLRKRAVFTVRDSNTASAEKVFLNLEKSNPGLKTEQWTFTKNLKVGPQGRTMMVLIDKESIMFIVNAGMKLYYLLQCMKVEIKRN
jgi:hypothetical protein